MGRVSTSSIWSVDRRLDRYHRGRLLNCVRHCSRSESLFRSLQESAWLFSDVKGIREIKKAASWHRQWYKHWRIKGPYTVPGCESERNFSTSTRCLVSEKTANLTDHGIVVKHKNKILNMHNSKSRCNRAYPLSSRYRT